MGKDYWPRDISTARQLQIELSRKIKILPLKRKPSYIAGIDAAFDRKSVVAVACLFEYPSLSHKADAMACEEIRFPYISGLLSFREGHAFIRAIRQLKHPPDVIIVDGQGVAHPLGIGIASHIGVLLGIPTIGCAKSRLVGDYEEPGRAKGQWTPLTYRLRRVGAVLRTRDDVRPLFVSPGHFIDLRSSIEIVLQSVTRFRIPEPIRRADHISKELARKGR